MSECSDLMSTDAEERVIGYQQRSAETYRQLLVHGREFRGGTFCYQSAHRHFRSLAQQLP